MLALQSWLDSAVWFLSVPVTCLYFLFGVDDLFIDLCSWVFGTRPEALDPRLLGRMSEMREKRLAIMIAAWHEDGVLRDMVLGNLKSIRYSEYSVFVGVYPNDPATMREAEELKRLCPNVRLVVNRLEGPTCKGQMLNEIVRAVLEAEREEKAFYHGFVIHDCEDVIHPQAFKVMNWELETHDFVQVPVFSLPLPPGSFVAGTYVDEFSEMHTKDLLVRDRFGVAIPSAGVGTALSRRLVQAYLREQGGELLNQRSLTEDYELGVSTQRFGLRSKFACYYVDRGRGLREYVATREYFPKRFGGSVRQRTRWTLGIAFQGARNLGWKGSWMHRYFLYRDRKGPFANLLVALGLAMFLYTLVRAETDPYFLGRFPAADFLVAASILNLSFMLNRIVQRFLSVTWVYGLRLAALSPVRLPVSNAINALAAAGAVYQYARSRMLGAELRWAKTSHELPAELRSVARSSGSATGSDTRAG